MEKEEQLLEEINDAEQWISLSDLMSGLMLIFLLIAVAFMLKVEKKQENMRDLYKEFIEKEQKLNLALKNEFTVEELTKWKVEILPTNIIRFKSPDVLFPIGKNELQPLFKIILKEFFPRYIKIISSQEFSDYVKEFRVEGHTDSSWNNNIHDSYIYNLDLSQGRAKNVLAYSISLSQVSDKIDWLKSRFRAVGFSSSNTLDEDSNPCKDSHKLEDPEKSRRVEFKIITKADEVLKQIELLGR